MRKPYHKLTKEEKLIVGFIYDLYKQYYFTGSNAYVKASLIDDFKHHNQTYLFEDIDEYINYEYLSEYDHERIQKIKDKMVCDLTEDERLVTFYDSEAKSFVTVPASNHPQSNLFKLTMQTLSNNEDNDLDNDEEVQKPTGLKGLLHRFFNK